MQVYQFGSFPSIGKIPLRKIFCPACRAGDKKTPGEGRTSQKRPRRPGCCRVVRRPRRDSDYGGTPTDHGRGSWGHSVRPFPPARTWCLAYCVQHPAQTQVRPRGRWRDARRDRGDRSGGHPGMRGVGSRERSGGCCRCDCEFGKTRQWRARFASSSFPSGVLDILQREREQTIELRLWTARARTTAPQRCRHCLYARKRF